MLHSLRPGFHQQSADDERGEWGSRPGCVGLAMDKRGREDARTRRIAGVGVDIRNGSGIVHLPEGEATPRMVESALELLGERTLSPNVVPSPHAWIYTHLDLTLVEI